MNARTFSCRFSLSRNTFWLQEKEKEKNSFEEEGLENNLIRALRLKLGKPCEKSTLLTLCPEKSTEHSYIKKKKIAYTFEHGYK